MLSQGYGLDAVCSGQLGIRHNVIAEMKAKCGFHGWSPNLANELPKEFLKLWIPCTSSHLQLNRSPLTEGPGVPGELGPALTGKEEPHSELLAWTTESVKAAGITLLVLIS